MGFRFYASHYPPLSDLYPITLDYSENNLKKLEALKTHKSDIFIHSGNWWSMKHPEERNTISILESVKNIHQIIKKANSEARIMGIMSCNTQPIVSKKKEPFEGNIDEFHNIPYWMNKPEKCIPFIEESLKNANEMLDKVVEIGGVKIPVYCTLQVIDEDQAERFFQQALDVGHKYFAIGVSELLKEPKYKYEGIKKIFQITHRIKRVIGKHDFHLSGLSSYNLIPFAYYLGASSCDGSTPVQSALAYGSIFNLQGFGQSASLLAKSIEMLKNKKKGANEGESENVVKSTRPPAVKWFLPEDDQNRCQCAVCHLQSPANRIKFFNEGNKELSAAECRVTHNLFIWHKLITQLNLEMHKDSEKWIDAFVKEQNTPYLKKINQITRDILQ
jgi:hypothetical protein